MSSQQSYQHVRYQIPRSIKYVASNYISGSLIASTAEETYINIATVKKN